MQARCVMADRKGGPPPPLLVQEGWGHRNPGPEKPLAPNAAIYYGFLQDISEQSKQGQIWQKDPAAPH